MWVFLLRLASTIAGCSAAVVLLISVGKALYLGWYGEETETLLAWNTWQWRLYLPVFCLLLLLSAAYNQRCWFLTR